MAQLSSWWDMAPRFKVMGTCFFILEAVLAPLQSHVVAQLPIYLLSVDCHSEKSLTNYGMLFWDALLLVTMLSGLQETVVGKAAASTFLCTKFGKTIVNRQSQNLNAEIPIEL
jgi:hypothetical protein